MNESSFSRWLCGHFKDQGLFAQRLEVTTGAGIPDLAVLGTVPQEDPSEPPIWLGKTFWIELKWKTKHIRPEQYVWGLKAQNVGVNVNYVVGYEETFQLYSLDNAQKMAKSFKLTQLLYEGPRNKDNSSDLIAHLQ
jgi:hypothetical protein